MQAASIPVNQTSLSARDQVAQRRHTVLARHAFHRNHSPAPTLATYTAILGSRALRVPDQTRRVGVAIAVFAALVGVGVALRAAARLASGLDHRLIADAVSARTGALTSAAHTASFFGRSWVLILMTALLAVGLAPRLGRRAFGPLVAVLGADLMQNVIKAIVNRPRPTVAHLEHVTSSSFPSGHATQSSAVAVAIVLLARGRPRRELAAATFVAALVIAAVATSRVYLGVHYPTDVLAGILLGAAWGVTAAWLTSG